jgi:aldehyde dehydrogenase (NAD+)
MNASATATERRKIAPPKIRQTKMLIDGKWLDSISGETFETFNPVDESTIANVARGNADDVNLAVDSARKALESGPWARMNARERGRLLYKLADLMEKHIDELAALETLDNGKPFRDARGADLPLSIDCYRYYAGWADKIHGQTIPVNGDYFCYTRREPVGVVGQIIPWNFPLLMQAWKWAPALAAGCTSVLKPAEQTPLSALRVGELALEAGFPDGVINIVPGFGDTGAEIVRHPGVDKIAFTGEHRTAQHIMKNAAETLKRVTFELGGKSPNVVFADADLDAAAAGSTMGIFFNQGQCCCAGSRLYVEDSVHDAFVEKLVARAKVRKVGDPFDLATEQGPQVDKAQFDKIMNYIDYGREDGARCAVGGERIGERGYFVQPTVFTDVDDRMRIATDEIFGPVLSIFRFKHINEVIERANNTMFGLAAAVWTRDVGKAHLLAKSIRAGTVWINCYNVFDAAAPFGGFKMSGQGRELGERALESYTENKTVYVQLD